MKTNIVNNLLVISFILLSTFMSNGQNLLNRPQKIVIDSEHDRYLVSNWQSEGDLVAIDSLGNQSYFVENAGMVDGMHIVGDTVYGSGPYPSGTVRGYDLETGFMVMDLDLSGDGVQHLSSFVSDPSGILYTSERFGTRIFKINPKTQEYWVFAEGDGIDEPNGLLYEPEKNRLLVCLDQPNPPILAISLIDSTVSVVATTNLEGSDGIAKDMFGNYYITGYELPGIYKFEPDFNGEPELFFEGTYIIYPTYNELNNSLLITYYYQNDWGEVPLEDNLLNNPESVVYDPIYNRYLVSNWEDGNIIEIDNNNNQQYFSTILEQSAGLHIVNNTLYAASTYGPVTGLVGFDLATGEIVSRVDIPDKELINDITSDFNGNFYVTDCDANKIYKIRVNDSSYTTFVESGLGYPNGIYFDQQNNRLLVLNGGLPGRPIIAVHIEDSTTSVIVETNKNAIDGLTVDSKGNYYFSSWGSDCVFMYDESFTNPPEVISSGHTDPADIFINTQKNILAVPNFNANTVDFIPLGSIIHVPDDFPTIQDGINASMNGDTVLVAPGTYTENINFYGKNIMVASHFIIDKDNEYIHNTIIDGSGSMYNDTASCVRFVSGESNSAQLSGFTICNGTGTHWVDPQYPSWTWHSGGGVFIFNSSPTISYNIIENNHVDDPFGADGASGGGLCTFGGNPMICNNRISDNTALYGAGVVIDYSGCEFRNNVVSWNSGGQSYGGGGIWTIGNGDFPIILENNTIANNEVLDNGLGGAMYLWSTEMTASNNIIYFNFQPTGDPIYLKEGSSINISYSNVEGGFAGEGNIDMPPTYADAYYVLQPISPCVDAGNPDPQFYDTENPNSPGSAMWPSLGTLRNDMGVYGGSGCFFLGYNIIGIDEIANDENNYDFTLNCFPNPMINRIEINYVLSCDQKTKIKIFDILGCTVNEIVNGVQSAGEYTAIWNGMDKIGNQVSSGIYFCSFESGNRKVISKLIKLD